MTSSGSDAVSDRADPTSESAVRSSRLSTTTRRATPADRAAFLDLARQYADEFGLDFSEAAAVRTFDGNARHEPAIHLVEENGDVVGFAIVRSYQATLTEGTCVEQEVVFVRADRRDAGLELCLSWALLFEVQNVKGSDGIREVHVLALPGNDVLDVTSRLLGSGFKISSLRLSIAPANLAAACRDALSAKRTTTLQ